MTKYEKILSGMKPSEEEIENAIGLSFRALEEFVDGLEDSYRSQIALFIVCTASWYASGLSISAITDSFIGCKFSAFPLTGKTYPRSPFSKIAICSAFVFSAMSMYGFIAL